MKPLQGAIGVTVTPFTDDWQVDTAVVRAQAERLAQSDIAGVFPCASTGEFPNLSPQQRRDTLLATREGLGGRRALIGGACAPSLHLALEEARMCRELGCDACVACPPYYYPYAQAEIVRFYEALGRDAGLPVIMYHVPFFTSGIAPETVEQLSRLPNIIGIKDSSANMKRIAHLCQLHNARRDFLVYTGTDDCLFPALAAGVDGSMTAFAAGVPELVAGVYEAARAGDMPLAAERQNRMMPLLRAADALPFPLGYKLVAQCYHRLPMTRRVHQLVSQEAQSEALAQIELLLQDALRR